MKFSTFTSVACLVAGVFAAPHVGQQEVAAVKPILKRDAADAVSQLESQVNNVVALANEITAQVSGAAPDVANITGNLVQLNVTLNAVGDALSLLGLDLTVTSGGLVSGLLGNVLSATSTLVGSLTGGGLIARDTTGDALSNIASATQVAGLLGSLLVAVSGVVNTLTNAINAGTLGSLTSTATGAVGGVTGVTGAGNVLGIVGSILGNVLGAL